MRSNRELISIVALVILTALPVSGAVCAMLCGSSAPPTTAAHHGSGSRCDSSPEPAAGAQIRGLSGHDCGTHGGSVRQATSTVAQRSVDWAALGPLASSVAGGITPRALRVAGPFDRRGSGGTAPPTTIPRVLRL